MHDVRHYNIHDLISFSIVRSRDRGLLKPINLEFSFFETIAPSNEPDLILNISRFLPIQDNCHFIDRKYRVGRNYFYCSDSARRSKWEVEITGFESGRSTINFWGRLFGKEMFLYPDLLAQDLVLKPLLEYKLCLKNILLVHAAAISRDNEAYLLAGRGGAHKTTLAMQLIKQSGFRLMADDQALIHNDMVLSFPKHIAQLCYKLDYMQTEDYSLIDKIRIIGYLRKKEFILQIPRSAPLRAVVFVSRTNSDRISVAEIPTSLAVERLVANNKMDMNSLGDMYGLFLRYMHAYSFVFPNSDVASHWHRLRQALIKTLTGVPVYAMQIPRTYPSDTLEVFERLVRDLG